MAKEDKNYFDRRTDQEQEEYYLHKKYGQVRLNDRQFILCTDKCCM